MNNRMLKIFKNQKFITLNSDLIKTFENNCISSVKIEKYFSGLFLYGPCDFNINVPTTFSII